MKKVIREPSRFILQNVVEGEDCVIHILNEEDYIVTYNLFNKQNNAFIQKPISLDEVITYESRCPIELRLEHTEKVKKVIQKIEQLDKIYHNCTYGFLFKQDKLYLLSYAYEENPYPYSMVLHLNKILGLTKCTPNWTGKFSQQILSAFYEDVFIQKK